MVNCCNRGHGVLGMWEAGGGARALSVHERGALHHTTIGTGYLSLVWSLLCLRTGTFHQGCTERPSANNGQNVCI